MGRAHRVAAQLKAGVVWVNTYDLFSANVPFGGFKQSGYGRDNGQSAVEAFTEAILLLRSQTHFPQDL